MVNTLISYLSSEAIENTVICLNYKIDNIFLYGTRDIIEQESSNIGSFLKEVCHIKNCEFISIDEMMADNIVDSIENTINDNTCIDLTGSNGLFIYAATKISQKCNIPMVSYDIYNDKLISIVKYDTENSIFNSNKIKLTLDSYIKMVGGKINYFAHKNNKESIDSLLIEYKNKHQRVWSQFVYCLQRCTSKDPASPLKGTNNDLIKLLNEKGALGLGANTLIEMLDDCQKLGFISRSTIKSNYLSFYFASTEIKNTMLETGAILEYEVYKEEKEKADDCMIGVHLDWDGIETGDDVINEIDVLSLNGYIPTFISCKDKRKFDKTALYEIESVARRFGGNYCKMKIVTTTCVNTVDKNRAKSIGIDIVDNYSSQNE